MNTETGHDLDRYAKSLRLKTAERKIDPIERKAVEKVALALVTTEVGSMNPLGKILSEHSTMRHTTRFITFGLVVALGSRSLANAPWAAGQTGAPPLNKIIGTLGDSELRGAGTLWFWSMTGITPIDDWQWNERKGHVLSAMLAYKSDSRIRTRVNTAWGGTTSRDWATDGSLTGVGQTTPNSPNADRSRVFRWHPRLVLVSVGMNDSSNLSGIECSIDEHKIYFGQILDSIKSTGATPFVLISPPRDDEISYQSRNVDSLTVGQALSAMTDFDIATCKARKIPYLNTRELLRDASDPSKWDAQYRLDGVHWHRPPALKVLTQALLARPEVQKLLVTPVRVAQKAPTGGTELGNLIRFSCFQGGFIGSSTRPRGWSLSGDVTTTVTDLSLETVTDNPVSVGKALVLTRTGKSAKPKVVTQDISSGFSPGDELRFSGLFRASGFGDRAWADPADPTNPRCGYSILLRFADRTGKDLGQEYVVAACDSWSIDTDGDWWRFYSDCVVPPNAAIIRVQIISESLYGPSPSNARLEVGNLSLRYLGPGGGGVVYP